MIARGLPASPVQQPCKGRSCSLRMFAEGRRRAKAVILVRHETSPGRFAGIHVAKGILTARGGMILHAAVVARGMGKCCISGAGLCMWTCAPAR